MKKKVSIWISLSVVSALLFAALIVLLCTFDRQPIGPQESVIGLAGINGWFFTKLGENAVFYEMTELLGLVAFAAVGALALVALVQWIKRKNLFKIDRQLWVTVLFLGVMAIVYVLFEKVVINYRPVLEDGQLAASFPSSHTMLVCCVMWAAVSEAVRLLPVKGIRVAVATVCVLVAVLTTVGRLISGVHWFSDIVGAVLISAALGFAYNALLLLFCQKGEHDQD